VAIPAFSCEQLSALGVTNTKQLGLVMPGLQFSEIAGFTLMCCGSRLGGGKRCTESADLVRSLRGLGAAFLQRRY
jgi:hypothetical protein